MASYDRSVDFVVVGSGAAAMAAAVRAHDLGGEVLLLEKTDLLGGNSAMSGGVCWVANNPHMRANGIPDSEKEGFAYLRAFTKGVAEEERLRQYINESLRLQDRKSTRLTSSTVKTSYA